MSGPLSDFLNQSLLATPSCTVIERKQTLVLKISNETFRLFFCLVGAISFQTVEYIGRRSLILL